MALPPLSVQYADFCLAQLRFNQTPEAATMLEKLARETYAPGAGWAPPRTEMDLDLDTSVDETKCVSHELSELERSGLIRMATARKASRYSHDLSFMQGATPLQWTRQTA